VPIAREAWPSFSIARPFRAVARALADTRRYPGLLRMVVGSWFYQDAIGTVMPATLPPACSTSPTCTPTRISTPSFATS